MRYSDWEQRQMDIKSGEELDRRTATISINVPKERYWPKGWQRPTEYPTFQAVEIGDNRLGMEVRQDGAWVRLPSQAALHIRVMTVQVAELRDALQFIANQEALTFAECSVAEEIIRRAKAALDR
jgi:hypothetical protein